MGIFDRIIKIFSGRTHQAGTLSGLWPVYGQYGTDIYAYDVVRQAISCIADDVKKLSPRHIRINGTDPVPVTGSTVQAVLKDPNPLMTTSEFFEKVTLLLLLNQNAFVLPIYRTWTDPASGAERRYYEALWPIKPSEVDFLEDASGALYIRFTFPGGATSTVPYDTVIHLRYHFGMDEYMGGGDGGTPDHRPLLHTIHLYEDVLSGIAKAAKAAYAVNGIIKVNTILDKDKAQRAIEELTKNIRAAEDGFVPLDLKGDITQLKRDIALVDPDTIKFLDEKILRTWGVSLPILRGDFNRVQYAAFYQKAIEPLVISIGQAFTKKLFTRREKAYGNEVRLYPKDLVFMTIDQINTMVQMLSPSGAITENEKRGFYGLAPLPELEGKRYVSLNWINADEASQYQNAKNPLNEAKKASAEKPEERKNEESKRQGE